MFIYNSFIQLLNRYSAENAGGIDIKCVFAALLGTSLIVGAAEYACGIDFNGQPFGSINGNSAENRRSLNGAIAADDGISQITFQSSENGRKLGTVEKLIVKPEICSRKNSSTVLKPAVLLDRLKYLGALCRKNASENQPQADYYDDGGEDEFPQNHKRCV